MTMMQYVLQEKYENGSKKTGLTCRKLKSVQCLDYVGNEQKRLSYI